MNNLNNIVNKTATNWKIRAKKDRKNRPFIKLKNKLILFWLNLID